MLETLPILETIEHSERQTFHIASDDAANWYLRKLANIEAEKQRVLAQAAEIVKRLDADALSLRFLYETQLQAYARHKIAQSGSQRRSVTFLQGTCAFRTVRGRLSLCDERAALTYAQEHLPQVVQTLTRLDSAGYRQAAEVTCQETGELLPGVEIVPEGETFRVTFGKPERVL